MLEEEKKIKSIQLRYEGKSINQTAKIVGVSYGTIYKWVKDITLTNQQKKNLAWRDSSHLKGGRPNGTKTKKRAEMGEDLWKQYQENKATLKKEKFKTVYNALWWATKRRELKQKLVTYKGGKCIECGYSKCLAAMEFHHRDPSLKDFNIATISSINFEKVKKEADKCDLMCNRCHVELHDTLNVEKRKNISLCGHGVTGSRIRLRT
jgi:transposase